MYDQNLKTLHLLREATERGMIIWQQEDKHGDSYRTTTGPLDSWIKFKWVTFNGQEGSDRDFVEVGGAGHHMAGTQGWWLAVEILAAGGVARWADHQKAHRQASQKTIDMLNQLLSDKQQ